MLRHVIRSKRRARLVEDTPRSKIATAPQGFVEIEGFAWPASRTCKVGGGLEAVYYHFQLQKQVTKGSGKSKRTEWVTVHQHVHNPIFYVVDATGLACIDPSEAELNIDHAKICLWSRLPEAEKQRVRTELVTGEVANFPPSNFAFGLFGSKFRIVENEILVGSPVYASGDYRAPVEGPVKTPVLGLKHFFDRVFDPVSRSKRHISHLDTNNDGKIDAHESKRGYSIAGKSALLKGGQEEFEIFGTLGRSQSTNLFVADVAESHLVERLQKWLWLKFAAGSGLVTAGVVLCLMKFAGFKPDFELKPRRAVAAVEPSVSRTLHYLCVGGNANSCSDLVRRAEEFHLNPENKTYYAQKACAAGFREHCRY